MTASLTSRFIYYFNKAKVQAILRLSAVASKCTAHRNVPNGDDIKGGRGGAAAATGGGEDDDGCDG